MEKKTDIWKLVSLGSMLLSGAAYLFSGYVEKKELEMTVEEKVNEALAAKEKESE